MAQGQPHHDQSNDFLAILFIGAIAFLAVGYFWGNKIKAFYLTLKLWQVQILAFIFQDEKLNKLSEFLINTDPKNLDLKKIMEISSLTTTGASKIQDIASFNFYTFPYIALVLTIFFGILIYRIWSKNPLQKFTRKHSMQSLMNLQKDVWPFINPVAGLDLINVDLKEGTWAMPLHPHEFVIKYKLLDKEKDLSSLNKRKAEKLFSSQLGRMWEGPDKLPRHMRALFGIFAAQICSQNELAYSCLEKLARSAPSGKAPDFNLILNDVKKFETSPEVLEIVQKHAYVYTVLCSMLENAGKRGVLATSQFLWLRAMDRMLFMVLNCVGRKESFVELAGIFSHWQAEKIANHPIEKPFIIKALDGLEKALTEIKLK